MKSFKVEGKVVEITSPQMVGEYKKREIVIEIESKGDFPNTNICLVAWNEKADIMDEHKVGDNVNAEFRPKSIKSKKGAWFSNLNMVSLSAKQDSAMIEVNSDNDDCPF